MAAKIVLRDISEDAEPLMARASENKRLTDTDGLMQGAPWRAKAPCGKTRWLSERGPEKIFLPPP